MDSDDTDELLAAKAIEAVVELELERWKIVLAIAY